MIAIGVVEHPDLRAAATRLDPRAARERLRARRALGRRAAPQDPRLARPPERDLAGDRAGDARARDRDHRRRRPRLPRPRPAGSGDAGVGDDADATVDRYLQTRARSSRSFPGVAIVISVLGFNLIGDGLREALDPKLRAATRERSRSRSSRVSRDLRRGAQFWTARGTVHAVNGISFDIAPGRDARHRRRVRLRQERDVARAARHPAARRARHRGAARCSTAASCSTLSDSELRGDPRPRDRDDLPGPDDEPEPGAHDRAADPRGARDAPRHATRTPPRAAPPSCSTRSASRAPSRGSRTTRTSSRAGCGSGR